MPRMRSEMTDVYAKLLENEEIKKVAYPFTDEWTEQGRESSNVALKDGDPLYGLHHPDSGYDKEGNIVEVAHPEPVIINQSYDKINGLVENVNERASIMHNLALNKPLGLLARNKYATQELTLELVKIANEMDSEDQEKLFALADTCLMQISAHEDNRLKKKAWVWLALGAVALGAKWLSAHMDNPSKGLLNDCDKAIKSLNNLAETSWYEGEVDETVINTAKRLSAFIAGLKSKSVQYIDSVSHIDDPRTGSELKEYLPHLKEMIKTSGNEIESNLNNFKKEVAEIHTMLDEAITNFTKNEYQQQHRKSTMIDEFSSWLGEATSGRYGAFANDFIAAANALGTLKKSMTAVVEAAAQLPEVIAKKEAELAAAEAAVSGKPAASSSAPSAPSAPRPKVTPTDDEEKEMENALAKNRKAPEPA